MKVTLHTIFALSLLIAGANLNAQRCETETEVGISAAWGIADEIDIGFGFRIFDRDRCDRPRRVRQDRDYRVIQDREIRVRRDRDFRGRSERILPRHPIVMPNCPVYGRIERDWEDDEEWAGLDLWDTHPDCAVACYEETVHFYTCQLGPPMETSAEQHCDGIEQTSTWLMNGTVLTVTYLDTGEEHIVEVHAEYEGGCDW